MNMPNVFQRLGLGVQTRRELSFTTTHDAGDDSEGRLDNWNVRHGSDDYWNQGVREGERFAREVIELALVDEEEAYNAVRFALDSPNWRGGWGQENGFASGLAALVVAGVRALANGAEPYTLPDLPDES